MYDGDGGVALRDLTSPDCLMFVSLDADRNEMKANGRSQKGGTRALCVPSTCSEVPEAVGGDGKLIREVACEA